MFSSNDVNEDAFIPKVLVLMATYNGSEFLSEQIDSILNQRGVEVMLLITDDCSTDESYRIAQRYAQIDSRVIARRNQANAGVGMNFLNMLYGVEASKYDYVAFSDQDDVWLDDKLAIACKAIEDEAAKPEAKHVESFGVPVLYCSDLQNVDANLENPVWELRSLCLDHEKRATPLVRNYYSGCTMVMNGALVRLFQNHPLSDIYRIHDVWLALVARYCGNLVIDLENARILRRITGDNVAGANTPGNDLAKASFSHLRNEAGLQCSKTAQQLCDSFGKYMSQDDRELVASFATYRDSLARRVCWALRMDYRGTTLAETMYQKAKLLFGRL